MNQNSVRINRLTHRGLIFVWSIALWTGCHNNAMGPPERAVSGHLLVAITPSSTDIRAGQALEVDVAITNTADSLIELCKGNGTAAHLWGVDSKYVKLLSYQVVDHPRCTSVFTLLPGASRHWKERFLVPSTPAGRAKLMIAVQVINPKRCRQAYGCDDFWLTASFEPLTVLTER